MITGIEETEEGIYLKGERGGLFVKEGEIVEGKEKEIYEYDEDADGAYSRILCAELHRIRDRFELHLFVSNCDEYDREDLWYLTVSGSDILNSIKIKNSACASGGVFSVNQDSAE